METQVLLSSVVALPRLKPAFQLAKQHHFDGIELFPYRWTTGGQLTDLANQYNVPVVGVHFPFWWETKSLAEVVASETWWREKGFACLWWMLFGPGHLTCPAMEVLRVFPEAYCLVHPDVFTRAGLGLEHFLQGREVFVENERPKIGEGVHTYNPYRIRENILPLLPKGQFMFDPRHIIIAQKMGYLSKGLRITTIYRELKPEGLHLSFGQLLHQEELAETTREHPPRYIVVETIPGPGAEARVGQARNMLHDAFGI
ncbi:MAG: hypothetical protein HY396_02640 [Candidatus Doudnabacteria bacterium]|nr:hypothetical protein [Candidatus Doudnabacteria bacterium]